jgi:hypothetical protein
VCDHPCVISDSGRLARHPAKVFICHDSRDREIARDLSHRILDAGFGVWLDAICLIAGQRFEYEIRDALDTADAVVVLISPGSEGKTGFIQREIRLVLEAADSRPEGAIYLIPVLIDGAAVPSRFSHLHCIRADGDDWFQDRGTAAYRRRLRVPPEAPPGTYRLVAAIWSERTGDTRLSAVECGSVDVLP